MTARSDWDIGVRVARGVAVLDRRDPGWWQEDAPGSVCLSTLRMGDPRLCLLGQRYQSLASPNGADPDHRSNPYLIGLRFLGLRRDEAAAHGFTGVDAEQLTAPWQEVIAARRSGHVKNYGSRNRG